MTRRTALLAAVAALAVLACTVGVGWALLAGGAAVLLALAFGLGRAAAVEPPPLARALLLPDDPSLPRGVDLADPFWRANPSEPLKPSEIVRWRDITGHYECVPVSPDPKEHR